MPGAGQKALQRTEKVPSLMDLDGREIVCSTISQRGQKESWIVVSATIETKHVTKYLGR